MRLLPLILATTTFTLLAEDHAAPAAKAKPKAAAQAHAPTPAGHGPAPAADAPDSPAAALAELGAGNARFVAGKRVRTLNPGQDAALRAALVHGQAPFAVVITCSDSRINPNLITATEPGELFLLRNIGNLVSPVSAAGLANGKALPGNLWALQAGMAGLLESTPQDPNEDAKAHLGRLEEANARRQAQAMLDRSALLRDLAAAEKLWVVPALYHLASGKVQFFKPLAVVPAPPAHH